jgi:hypothetical protein
MIEAANDKVSLLDHRINYFLRNDDMKSILAQQFIQNLGRPTSILEDEDYGLLSELDLDMEKAEQTKKYHKLNESSFDPNKASSYWDLNKMDPAKNQDLADYLDKSLDEGSKNSSLDHAFIQETDQIEDDDPLCSFHSPILEEGMKN